jgi:hypothetical protein
MEFRQTTTAERSSNFIGISDYQSESEIVRQRLDFFLAANAETARQKAIFRTDHEVIEAGMMQNPLTIEKTFAYFGLLLGTFPPAAIFAKFALDSGILYNDGAWILGVMFIINLISAIVGYFSGKFIARSVRELENYSWHSMLLIAPFIGMIWGIIAGGAGGVIVFVFGAFFGAFLGSLVGGAALPIFTVFHRWLKKGDMMELKHFLPLAFGITFTICAFIFGL